MQYKLVITKFAEQDLIDIAEYISKNLSAPVAALNFLEEVNERYKNISITPYMYPLCDHARLKHKSYRKSLIKNYIMFYRVNEEDKTVYVMRFIYGGRDYLNII